MQFAFIGSALVLFWFLDHFVLATWTLIADLANLTTDPSQMIVTPVAALLGILGAVLLYRNPKVHRFANEVAAELSKVTWPTRKETWNHTVTVVIVSIIAAVILGIFDATWSSVTDLIYPGKQS
ncbi:MAG: preprotein translocase subunit SecE [Myxococcales bacterium]|nr:preprotein translocase subunit SecE [Myxococcales bacterium]